MAMLHCAWASAIQHPSKRVYIESLVINEGTALGCLGLEMEVLPSILEKHEQRPLIYLVLFCFHPYCVNSLLPLNIFPMDAAELPCELAHPQKFLPLNAILIHALPLKAPKEHHL